jgi:hypothetical protein
LVPLPAVIETAEQPPATLDEPLTVLPAPTHPPLPLPPPPPRLSPRERLPQASLRERFAALARLRRLDRGWRDLGRFLSEPDRGLSRRSDAVALGVALTHLRALLLHAPDGMASPDRPGHLIAALIRSPLSPRTLRELLPSQKEALARDWRAGADLLARAQRRERREVRKLRPPPTFARQVRWGWYFVVQYPDLAWLSMAAAGLGIACWRAFVSA